MYSTYQYLTMYKASQKRAVLFCSVLFSSDLDCVSAHLPRRKNRRAEQKSQQFVGPSAL